MKLKKLLFASSISTVILAASLEPFFATGSLAALAENRFIYGPRRGNDSRNIKRAKATKANTTSTSTLSTSNLASDPTCTNSPSSRNCWANGYSVVDDFDVKWPTTGVTRYYTLTISNVTCNPDGARTRYCSLVNGQSPGPIIRANWGDMIQVTVNNNMKRNGTDIHWHGIRQLNSYLMDGVGGVTECPLAPGYSTVYTFQATQFGSSFYHSHHSSQAGDGIEGPIIIDGPTSANWDIDLGPLPMTDWNYISSFALDDIAVQNALKQRGPLPGDNVLINGTNMNPAGTTGKYAKVTLTAGKRHLIRVMNLSKANQLRFSIDGHNLTIITADFVPIIPIPVQSVLVGIGQRYEIIVEANQTAGNYWLRAEPEYVGCLSENYGTGKAIVTYSTVKSATPKTQSSYTDGGVCLEPGPLTPWVPNTVGSQQAFISQASELSVSLVNETLATNNESIIVWGLNFTAMHVDWTYPVVSYLMAGNTSFPRTENLVEIATENEWVFWIIQDVDFIFPLVHPMHLHGHDFYLLGTGVGTFDINSDPANLKYNNPTRRDTAILPPGGWMVMAFPTDNPGTWLMHCHISTHASQGLSVQFIEAAPLIKLPSSGSSYSQQCATWNQYYQQAIYKQEGSGV